MCLKPLLWPDNQLDIVKELLKLPFGHITLRLLLGGLLALELLLQQYSRVHAENEKARNLLETVGQYPVTALQCCTAIHT